jgi:hypothetical protein
MLVGFFYMPQIHDMGLKALLPLRTKACYGSYHPLKYEIISKNILGPGQNLYVGSRNQIMFSLTIQIQSWIISNLTELNRVQENIPFQPYQKQYSLLKKSFLPYRTSPVYISSFMHYLQCKK